MNADVPTGEVDAAPTVLDEGRLAATETRMARSYVAVVSAARRLSDREMGGYSLVYLAVVEAEHPERTTLHTWTDPTNAAMYRTNANFGFAPVEIMHEMQRVD